MGIPVRVASCDTARLTEVERRAPWGRPILNDVSLSWPKAAVAGELRPEVYLPQHAEQAPRYGYPPMTPGCADSPI